MERATHCGEWGEQKGGFTGDRDGTKGATHGTQLCTAEELHRRAITEAQRELPSNQCYELLHRNQTELPNRFSGTQHW
jgi:hypothetical protein